MQADQFYKSVRRRDSGVFGTSMSQRQVDGVNSLLAACAGFPLAHAAHVLAEVYHETGGGMMPVKETVYPNSKDRNPSDATVISRLDRAFAKRQMTWVKTPYWRDGWFGRGQIQLTHKYNYEKAGEMVGVNLAGTPQMALQLNTSARIAATGCQVGLFTGKKLSDFDGPEYDHYNARAIVNGDKRKNGKLVAGYGRAFEAALVAADWQPSGRLLYPIDPVPDIDPTPPPIPIDATFIKPDVPLYLGATPKPPATNWVANIIAAIASLFGRNAK